MNNTFYGEIVKFINTDTNNFAYLVTRNKQRYFSKTWSLKKQTLKKRMDKASEYFVARNDFETFIYDIYKNNDYNFNNVSYITIKKLTDPITSEQANALMYLLNNMQPGENELDVIQRFFK